MDLGRKEFGKLNWFMFSLWASMLIMGITLLILSGNTRYILWVKERIGISEERVRTMEQGSAVFLIAYAILSIISLIFHTFILK